MSDTEGIRETLENHQAIDRLAAIEHDRWAHWQQYLHDQCERRDDGSLVIPAELVSQWEEQIRTPYEELAPEVQESDREQVQRYLPTVIEILTD
ncbi:hypothetical protein AB0D56_36410 [Streptomyces sp. NPDC048209]|uniref:hypothetical protein n=1 Tax=Streptomyces TaxID=1883 RepID=UPI003433D848